MPEIVACKTCRDFRKVDQGAFSVKCPECQDWPPEKRIALLKDATRAEAEKPSISEMDLTDEERALFVRWQGEHTHVHKLTLLTWIEGRRYDPSKDQEFLADARKRFKKWKFLRNSNEGPVPDWAKTALATGETKHLSKDDKEYVDSLKEKP